MPIFHNEIEQRSPEWYALRAGMPTASEFSNLLTPKTMKSSASLPVYAAMLANEKYTGISDPDGFTGNGWTDRGGQLEANAISWYEFVTGRTVVQIGFVTDDEKTIGCSPDGLVGGDGMIEIKALKAGNHTAAMLHHLEYGEAPPDYRAQTQGQMMICERQWCDLLFYHDLLPSFAVRQTPDQEYTAKLREGIAALLRQREKTLNALSGTWSREAAE